MFEALKQWRGESPSDSAAVDRLLAAAKRESRRREESIRHGATSTYWRDPFADDPDQLIPVRKEDRDLLDNLREGSRARAEMVMAQTEAAAARADAAAARTEAARAERLAARAEAQAAKRQAGCADLGARHEGRAGRNADAVGSTPSGESAGGLPSASRVHRIHAHRQQSREASALNPPVARVEPHRAPAPPDQPAPAAPQDSTAHSSIVHPSAGWTSSDGRGILVVPIEVSIPRARKPAQLR